jgi:hypothetical protein
MELREKLEENVKPLAIGVGVLVVLALLMAFLTMRSSGHSGFSGNAKPKLYYTVDDGKTWFEDDADLLPPYQHDGKTAVRVMLYKCGEGGQPFVGYLMRIESGAHKSAEAAKAQGRSDLDVEAVWQNSVEVKKPGDSKWVSVRDRTAEGIMIQKCPDKKTSPTMVVP